MANLIHSFSDLLGTFSEHSYLDDGFDRANRIYCPVLLMVSASLLGLIQFFGDPIECTKVTRESEADADYVKSYCWAHGTYAISNGRHLSYYQWVPVILALQAFFFQMPYIFWATRSRLSGLNLPSLMHGAFKLTEVLGKEEERRGIVKEVSHLMDVYFQRNLIKKEKSFKRKTSKNLTLCFFLAKILYLVNIVMQLILLNELLNEQFFQNFNKFVIKVFKRQSYEESELFPLLAECRFYNKIADINAKRYKSHLCTLPLNMYNDRVFAAICLMLIVMLLGMAFSILTWATKLFVPSLKGSLVHIVLHDVENHQKKNHVKKFIKFYLRTDGILVLKLIRQNMGVNASREIIQSLYERFVTFEKTQESEGESPELDRPDHVKMLSRPVSLKNEPPSYVETHYHPAQSSKSLSGNSIV